MLYKTSTALMGNLHDVLLIDLNRFMKGGLMKPPTGVTPHYSSKPVSLGISNTFYLLTVSLVNLFIKFFRWQWLLTIMIPGISIL